MLITYFETKPPGNALKAVFNLYWPEIGLTVRGMSLFEKNERRWVNFPSKSYTAIDPEKGETKKYFEHCQVDKSMKDAFQSEVIALCNEKMEKERSLRTEKESVTENIPF